MQLNESEDLCDLQLKGLKLIQKRQGFRLSMDAVLLSDFAKGSPSDHVVDFGTGTGVLPLLLWGKKKCGTADAVEILPEMAELAARNARLNCLEDRIRIHCCSVEEFPERIETGDVDSVICNPPYGDANALCVSERENIRTARQQSGDGIGAWIGAAYRILKGKGRMFLVYPASGMLALMTQLQRHRMEPKRFRLIYSYSTSPAKLVLLEAVRDAKPLLHPMPPLILYEQPGVMTREVREIYQPGESNHV